MSISYNPSYSPTEKQRKKHNRVVVGAILVPHVCLLGYLVVLGFKEPEDEAFRVFKGRMAGFEVEYFERQNGNEMRIGGKKFKYFFYDTNSFHSLGRTGWPDDALERAVIQGNGTSREYPAERDDIFGLDYFGSSTTIKRADNLYNDFRGIIKRAQERGKSGDK